MTMPASQIADGLRRVEFVLAISNPAAPTVAELTAGSAVPMSCYLVPDGWSPATDESVVNDSRLCSRDDFERRGRRTNTLSTTYVARPQETGADNKAFTTLKEGVQGFFVERIGLDYEAAFAAGQKVNVYPAEAGVQIDAPTEANSTVRVMQKQFIRGPVQRQVAVVA